MKVSRFNIILKIKNMTVTKPLRPKFTYSVFSIRKFIEEYYYPEFLIIGQNEFKKFKAKDSKHAKSKFRKRYKSEKILTVKKIK